MGVALGAFIPSDSPATGISPATRQAVKKQRASSEKQAPGGVEFSDQARSPVGTGGETRPAPESLARTTTARVQRRTASALGGCSGGLGGLRAAGGFEGFVLPGKLGYLLHLQIDRRAEVLDSLVGPEASRKAQEIRKQDAEQKAARKNNRIVEFGGLVLEEKEVQAEVRFFKKKVLVLVYHHPDQDENQHPHEHLKIFHLKSPDIKFLNQYL
jgi:hypothetical protein